MGSVTRFAALNTKVRALESQFLSDSDYLLLIQLNTYDEVVEALKTQTAYREVFEAHSGETMSISTIEALLRRHTFVQYEKLVHYLNNEDRKTFKVLLMRFEIESLKWIIRSIYRGETLEGVEQKLLISKIFSKLNYEALSTCDSLPSLIEQLKGTGYDKALAPYINENPKRILFYMEMNLDRMYFRALFKQFGKLKGNDRKYNEELLGINIDFLNLQWIFRGLRYYSVSSEELFNYSLMGGKYVNLTLLKALCYSQTDEAFMEIVKGTRYSFLFDGGKTLEVQLEREMEIYMYKHFLKLLKQSQMSILTPISYMHKLEYELRDIFSILEAKRYNMDAERVKGFLIRTF